MANYLTLTALLVGSLISIFSEFSYAGVDPRSMDKAYVFSFRMDQENLEITRRAPTYEEAFENAAKECYRHFKGGRHLSETQGLDIIDICANPHSI